MAVSAVADVITELIQSYNELNPQFVDELLKEPSPLEFMRYVAAKRPFVIRGGCSQWPATESWSAAYLVHRMEDRLINVAITPSGNADSVVTGFDGVDYFVKPLESEEAFTVFLNDIRNQENAPSNVDPVKYAQTQNDNLRGEYLSLFEDVQKEIAWARIALNKEPEAINLWIGNSRSVTALHKDNYENIYCQILGNKHFTLLPPVEVGCVAEKDLRSATYVWDANGALAVKEDEPAQTLPFPTWDPDIPHLRPTQFSHLSKPLRVTLQAGDMLYLPALWYHKVSQTCSHEDFCCAANYWYDMDFGGAFYPLSQFARAAALRLS